MASFRPSTPAGIAGSAGRLLFAAGLTGAASGLYIALFASLGARDPGRLWLHGLDTVGIGIAVSVVAFIALCAPRPRRRAEPRTRPARPQWYWYSYLLFGVTAVALLCLSSGLRLIGDWQRSNVATQATVSGCTTDSDDAGTSYSCTYDWDWQGGHHRQNRSAGEQYPDGREVSLWIDPVTGGADDHSVTPIVYSFAGAAGVGLVGLLLYFRIGHEVYEKLTEFRGAARTTPAPPVHETVAEDAQASGY
jgi:hypothetical protein